VAGAVLTDDVQLHPLTLDDVLRMVEAGILRETDRVELIDGVLVDMSPEGAPHAGTIAWLTKVLVLALSDEHEVRVQSTFVIEGGFLEPDLVVVEPVGRTRLPDTARLAVEIAVTSLRHDRWKAARYARAGVREYWLVDVPDRAVLVHREPEGDRYGSVTTVGDGDTVTPLLGRPDVDVSELLGPPA
jgi:Uma2 family endonuclease